MALEKAVPRYRRPGRPILVSGVPCGSEIDIWRACRFVGCLMRALCGLPQGIGRFIPCGIGAKHCRLTHGGWKKCGYEVRSRSGETSSVPFLNELEVRFWYPANSGGALLSGALPLRYCAARFAVLVFLGVFPLGVMLQIWLLKVVKMPVLCSLCRSS